MAEEKKWTVPRGAAATKTKNKYRDANYDRAELALPKGMKEKVKEIAAARGETFNSYVADAIREKYKADTGQELTWRKEG